MTLYYPIAAPYPVFTDVDGMPLEDGYIYIGQENQNPIVNPVAVYWDPDFLYPAAQPIRTLAGSPNRNGAPSPIYTASNYSMMVKSKTGTQIYYTQSSNVVDYNSDDSNLIPDGDFQTMYESHTGSSGDPDLYRKGWIFSNSGLDWEFSIDDFLIDQDDVPNNPKHFMTLDCKSALSATSDYYKMCAIIEDLYTVYGKYLTLSFYARLPSEFYDNTAFSTSFTIKETDAAARTTGLNVQKHTLTTDWQKFTTTFQVPEIDTTISPYPSNQQSGLIVNFWVNAGSDYDTETNGLSVASANVGVDIADIRLEFGSIANTYERIPYEHAQYRLERTFETSYFYMYSAFDDGFITYIAAGANAFIPGFQFRQKKRTSAPTIEICSKNDAAVGYVYKVGVGNVTAVAADVSYFGIGSITLGAATAANDVYQFQYVVKDNISL